MKFAGTLSITPKQTIQFTLQILLLLTLLIISLPKASAAGGGDGGAQSGKANYFDIEKPFVVNIADGGGRLRFVQISVNLMTMDSKAIDAVERHMAPIKHELLMLFSDQGYQEVISREAREELRHKALTRVQQVLKKYAYIDPNEEHTAANGKRYLSGVQDLYFTNFIIQ